MAQLLVVRHQDRFEVELVGLAGEDLSSSIWMSKLSAVSQDSARAGFARRASAAAWDFRAF